MARTRWAARAAVVVLVVAGLWLPNAPAGAAEPTQRERINKVGKRLLATIEPPAGMEWPPTFKKKAPPADPDDDVIVPGKKKTKAPPTGDDDVVVPKSKAGCGGAGGRSLVSLLKQANLKFETHENDDGQPLYKIPVTVKGQKSILIAFEVTMGKTDAGEEIKAAIVGAQVASFPSDYRQAIQLYKTLDDFNDKFVFGKGLVSSGGVNYFCPFWLRTADVTTLLDHLYLAHTGRLELKKRVQAVFDEE